MNFSLKTYGCKLNQADSELIKGLLSQKFTETSEGEADFIVLNSCGVVEKTERKIIKEALRLKKSGKKIIISGCLPLISPKICAKTADGVVGPANLSSIVGLADKIIKGEKIHKIGDSSRIDKAKLFKSKSRGKGISAIISIAEGCLGSCSYCATRTARKKLFSYAEENIIKEAREAVRQGYKEIQLTSQDLSVYGMDSGKQLLPELIDKLTEIDGNFKIKLGMMNPGYAKKMLKPLLASYESDKVYKFIHLPLQSGDDILLQKMNRGYSREDFLSTTKAFRKKFKESIIATDIIVGHPLETERAFKKTLAVIKSSKPDIIHIFKFSKRNGTPDAQLKDIPDRIKKERSRELTELFQKINLQKNKKYLGKEVEILIINKRGKRGLGRMASGRAVICDTAAKTGERQKVKIIDYRWNYLIARPSKLSV